MLSDIHFDPFHDPGKLAELRNAPASAWDAILRRADSPTQAADFEALQKTCGARGVDTPMSLLTASLAAQKALMPQPLFVTVSGDLMAHVFDCKFKTLVPGASEAEYSAFAAKTVEFVALELHATFPKSPVYLALGNNDSGCRDYREDENSAYLHTNAKSFAAAALNTANAAAIEQEFSRFGDYSVTLPSPMRHTRLLVIQNIFEASSFKSCSERQDSSSTQEQVQWLRAQLIAARAQHEKVWVMGHIPPGVNPFLADATTAKVCGSAGVAGGFLRTQELAATLAEFADVIKLAIFGHTHMDEIHLIEGSGQAQGSAIPMKLTPSMTTVVGNSSSFTIAQVDPARAMLMDYAVYSASNKSGVGATWSKEYAYSSTYHLPDFSSASVKTLTAGFVSDPALKAAPSLDYVHLYSTGDSDGISLNIRELALSAVWRGYGCAVSDASQAAFKACVCASAK
jgi:sphingomyelin phosphodiesterase acid-like 3